MSLSKYYDLIRKPIITEKSAFLTEGQNKFTFRVASSANKSCIKLAVENIFFVKVKKVHIINVLGKKKRFKGREGVRSSFKKAIVTLEKDCTIDFTGVKGS